MLSKAKILFLIIVSVVFTNELEAQKTKPINSGLYFISQKTSEWVGGGYYLLKQDSTFVFFTNLWDSIADCEAMDINPNYFGVGRWKINSANILSLEFVVNTSNYLIYSGSFSYQASANTKVDSNFIKLNFNGGDKNYSVEMVQFYGFNGNINIPPNAKILKPNNSGTIAASLKINSNKTLLKIQKIGFYSEEIFLAPNKNIHEITFFSLMPKGGECIQEVTHKNISNKVSSPKKDGKNSFGPLLEISKAGIQKEFIINKLKEKGNNSSSFSNLYNYILREVQKLL